MSASTLSCLSVLYCIPSLRRTLPSGCRLWYFHFTQPSRLQHNWTIEETTRIASRGSLAIECITLELILFYFDLLIGHGSVEVGIGVIHRTVLQTVSLVRKCSIGATIQFATLHRPLPMTCSGRSACMIVVILFTGVMARRVGTSRGLTGARG